MTLILAKRSERLIQQIESGQALNVFLKMVDADNTWNDGAARKAMLKVFDIIGPRSPLAEEYRAKLARVLYR